MRPAMFSLFSLAMLFIAISTANAQRPKPAELRKLRPPDQLKVGDAAPDFTLQYKGSDETFTLSDFKDDKPVALVFGSYT